MKKRPLVPQNAGEITDVSVRFHRTWAERFRRARWFVLLFLFVFVLMMLLFCKGSINYETFLFLLRDLDAEYHADADTGGIGVYYDADTKMTCQVFKDHLIVIDTRQVCLYGLSGYRVFSYAHNYQNPSVTVSDNYFIVYDLGGYGFSFYNAVGCLYENDDYDFPILDATVADNGTFGILTKNQTYRSTVQVYDNSCKLLASYHTMRYVTRIKLNENASRIQIASVYIDSKDTGNMENGVPRMVLQAYEMGKDREIYYLEYPSGSLTDVALSASSVIPIDICNLNNRTVGVLCNNGVLFASNSGKLNLFYSFLNDLPSSVGKLSSVAFGDGQLALLFLDDVNESKKHLVVLNNRGTFVYDGTIALDDNIIALSYKGNTLFLLSPTHVYKLEKNGKLTSVLLGEHSEIVGFFAYDSSTAIVSYEEKTVAISFD